MPQQQEQQSNLHSDSRLVLIVVVAVAVVGIVKDEINVERIEFTFYSREHKRDFK
jgi:hypothetical protein